jgi:hypothetical protein
MPRVIRRREFFEGDAVLYAVTQKERKMKQRNTSKMLSLKLSVLAIALTFGSSLSVYAGDNSDELKQRIEQLENQVKRLEALVEKSVGKTEAAPAAAASGDEQRAEFSRIQVKVEGMEDRNEALGYKDLKISGMIDPTYIYNQARDSSGFNFLSNLDARSPNEIYAYDNSYFGQALLQFDKELDGGTKLKLALVPHKSTSSGYNIGSIVHEASVSIPLIDSKTRLIAGQIPDWSGYEYYFGNQTKLITHNLLFDFTLPSFYTGAGMEFLSGQWDIKALVANMNQTSYPDSEKNPILTYRVDYAKGEYSGFGFAGQNGKQLGNQLDMFEVDGYFIRGDLTWMGQIGVGSWKNSAFNGGDAQWSGISNMLAYKFTPRLEGIARLDYLKNSKNGGGTIGTVFNSCVDSAGVDPLAPVTCDPTVATQIGTADYRNGFGPSAADISAAVADIKGANRSTLSLGMNYSLLPNVMFKAEYRLDHADLPVFYYVKDASYKNNNQLLGTSIVVNF